MIVKLLGTATRTFALVLLTAGFAWGQQPIPGSAPDLAAPRTPPQVSGPTTGFSPTNPVANSGLLQLPYLTQVSGLQGVLAETVEGNTIAAQSIDAKFNPASSVKLATTLVALKTLGAEYRFLTSVWVAGTIDRTNGILTGDLIVSGRDPSFHYENAVMLARDLNRLGIRRVTGNLIAAPGFTLNFDSSTKHSGEELRSTFDAATRSGDATRAWIDERSLVADNQSLSSVPSVVISGQVQVAPVPAGAAALLTHKSSKLVDILKVMLCYSSNFMAERLGESLGGPQNVRAVLIDKLKLRPDEILMASTSGLGVNRFTPRSMMKILRGLRDELTRNKLSLSDILPVAGIDPGTLEERYTDPSERGSVIAKTGTLVRTDGGASSLVGQMRTRSGRIVLFVILNQRGNVFRFRQNQDGIVVAIQNSLGGAAPFEYNPVKLSMRLADSESGRVRSRGDFEPRDQN